MITSHSSSPISSAEPSTIAPRKKPKRTSPGSRTLVGQALGAWMSLEMPPKAASIWSAMITDSAIVISAWRRSWPWFQRRKICWMSTPMTPMITVARTSGTNQPAKPYSASEAPLSEMPSPVSSANQRSCISSAR